MKSEKPNAKSIHAWNKFLDEVDGATKQLAPRGGDIWFRGHSKSAYKLTPSLFRLYPEPITNTVAAAIWRRESDLFWEFSARARELHASMRNDWDILFSMQHYRCPTRLLDWTEVLGVAVYFATLDFDHNESFNSSNSPCVWVLNPSELNDVSTNGCCHDIFAPENLGWCEESKEYYTYGELLLEDGMDFDSPLAVYPRQTNARMHAQRAWFTIHGDVYKPLESFKKADSYIRKVDLPVIAIPAAKRFLEYAGIDQYLLFSDLENLGKFVTAKTVS